AIHQASALVDYQSKVIKEKQLRLAESALNNGLAKCTEGKVSEGLLWLSQSLETAPADAHELDRVVRANRASWRRLLDPVLPHDDKIVAVAFSQDGKTVFTATPGNGQLWDTATGEPIGPRLALHGTVFAATLSPDGQTILTGSADNMARLMEVA